MTSRDDDLGVAPTNPAPVTDVPPTNPAPAIVIPVLDAMGPGRILAGRYEIVSRLGRGGMGAVFRVHDRELGEDVALKVILSDRLNDPGALDRFRRELKIARKITHPSVCRVFDMGEEGGLRFLTMELVEGRSLRELVAKGPLEAPRALALLQEIIDGVAAVHAQGIVHRDLKPDNILIRADGHAVVADFGLAHNPSSEHSSSTAFAGTPAYMSPEQLRGEPLDGRSDIFSLGIVAYEMLTGREPFGAGGPVTVASAILRDPPVPLEVPRVPPDVQQALEDAILRALAKAPGDRFEKVSDFGKALLVVSEVRSAPRLSNVAPETRAPSAADVKPTGKPGVRVAMALGAAVTLVGAVLLARNWKTQKTEIMAAAPAASSSAAPGTTPEAIPWKNEEAAALYKEAMHAMHDGDAEAAASVMERAASVDPDFGAARLRLAIWKLLEDPHEAREHHTAAVRLRRTLGERDAAILHAMEPWLHQPPNFDEWEKRLEAMLGDYPRDVEVLLLVAGVRLFRIRIDAAIEAADRALAVDPSNVVAWTMRAEGLSLRGDTAAELDAFRACIEANPIAVKCLRGKIGLRVQLGQCALMKEDAKHLLSIHAKSASTHHLLATALEAAGEPRESVLEALEKSFSLEPEALRKRAELDSRIALSVRDGDFDRATQMLSQQRDHAAPHSDQESHALPALKLALLYLEMGLPRKADEIAADYLRRSGAWLEDVDHDWAVRFLVIRKLSGGISKKEFVQTRAEWLEKRRQAWKAIGRAPNPELEWVIWGEAHGYGVETAEDAREAIEAMPRERVPAMDAGRLGTDVFEGRVHALVGNFERAIAPLRRAAGNCAVLSEPMGPPLARFYLGMALEGKGDLEGARVEYEKVVGQWGKAKPRSVTAERAREALKRLGSGVDARH